MWENGVRPAVSVNQVRGTGPYLLIPKRTLYKVLTLRYQPFFQARISFGVVSFKDLKF